MHLSFLGEFLVKDGYNLYPFLFFYVCLLASSILFFSVFVSVHYRYSTILATHMATDRRRVGVIGACHGCINLFLHVASICVPVYCFFFNPSVGGRSVFVCVTK